MNRNIEITIYLEQTCNDILAECNLIGKNLGENASAELQADIKSPDSPETRSIICRAHTEALGNVKLACHRYLMSGRTEDENRLERLATPVVSYTKEEDGVVYTYTPVREGQWRKWHRIGDVIINDGIVYTIPSGATEIITPEYEKVELNLSIPDFDTAVTDALKNHIHKYIVDYVMWRFLQNQANEKCYEYKKLADEEDYPNIVNDLTIRERFVNRTPQFY